MNAEPPDVEPDDPGEAAEAQTLAAAASATTPMPRRRQAAALVLTALLTGAGLALTGLMLWQHGKDAAQRAEDQRLVDAARQGVAALLSIDHTHAQADVQRVLDLSTGPFHDDFERSADDFVKTSVDSKAVTIGKVKAAALQSVEGERGFVMVVATSEVTNANGANNDPRPFRMSVAVDCQEDPCKISDVEFVP